MSDQLWAGIRERVAALGALEPAGKVFGAAGHGWTLADPLSKDEVTGLEEQLGVVLPEEYRTFLTRVGAGGAGPAYGLFPVRHTEGRWSWDGDSADLTDLSLLARPFPGAHPAADAVDALRAQCPDEDDFAGVEDFETAYEAWEERWADVFLDPARTAGAVVICDLGCALREWLVVSGPHRGTVWSDPRADDADLEPLLDREGHPLTFHRWYTRWLEEAESTTRGTAPDPAA
ncbi:SMI1/KNR4 family protein [Streptomyces yaizuensis]|uniref:SMI1/KNR4 family protein n=1 Tax=Streptomyces yaizuensis TaxID=2989713 RepID=A0ABQ5NSP9_9ACTN|nr:SMI1/KNR4 family protein [Streptomyces sp. YSPA8]GLF93406.1 SMI1/KNR4 family protein [Streptomyces sp. YSPA8]